MDPTKLIKHNLPPALPYENGAAQTPPMGWSSWNTFRNKISEALLLETAAALQKSGLAALGYRYVNIDDCWQSAQRDAAGRLQADLTTFPSGIKALAQKVNALGLKLGIYSSNGTLTCEDLPASYGHEKTDAETFADWGVEYLKYDFCHHVVLPGRAPLIEKIEIGEPNGGAVREYFAGEAVLDGEAQLVHDARLESGAYIEGLSYGGGSAVFHVDVPRDGLYAFTLILRKKSHAHKFLVIEVNEDTQLDTVVPPTWALSKEGRHQMQVSLREGENQIRLHNPVCSRFDSAAYQYARMGKAVRDAAEQRQSAPIVYSICEWGFNLPHKWAYAAGNLWRTTLDIKPFWASILAIYEINVRLHKAASPGHWNDPDMLEVGNGSLNYEENKAHFSLWCMMAAPLILGNDVRKFLGTNGEPNTQDTTYQIVSNKDLIAIDQDPLGRQCRVIWSNKLQDILARPLENGDIALCCFNKAGEMKVFNVDTASLTENNFLGLPGAEKFHVKELWSGREWDVSETLKCTVPRHGVKVFRLTALA
jgi:hypothetical protein